MARMYLSSGKPCVTNIGRSCLGLCCQNWIHQPICKVCSTGHAHQAVFDLFVCLQSLSVSAGIWLVSRLLLLLHLTQIIHTITLTQLQRHQTMAHWHLQILIQPNLISHMEHHKAANKSPAHRPHLHSSHLEHGKQVNCSWVDPLQIRPLMIFRIAQIVSAHRFSITLRILPWAVLPIFFMLTAFNFLIKTLTKLNLFKSSMLQFAATFQQLCGELSICYAKQFDGLLYRDSAFIGRHVLSCITIVHSQSTGAWIRKNCSELQFCVLCSLTCYSLFKLLRCKKSLIIYECHWINVKQLFVTIKHSWGNPITIINAVQDWALPWWRHATHLYLHSVLN